MPRLLPALVVGAALALTGCSGSPEPEPEPSGFSADVRRNFLSSCVQNATKTSQGRASQEQLDTTCECILGKVEQEYDEAEFRAFEQRLLDGSATEDENVRLTEWSTSCAQEESS